MNCNDKAREIFTIGHSNHAAQTFVGLLKSARITALADIRSVPYSRRIRAYNRNTLSQTLNDAGIAYVYLGDCLGGRPAERTLYRDGKPAYDLISASAPFGKGIERIEKGAGEHRIALMCAERDPIYCHRTRLVAPVLLQRGFCIRHLLHDGTIEEHEQTERRRLLQAKPETGDLFAKYGEVRRSEKK